MKVIICLALAVCFVAVVSGDSACRRLGGTCRYTYQKCRNGRFVRYKCNGPSYRQCCVPITGPTGNTMTHSQAARQLSANGIRISSSGGCSARYRRGCTSLDGVRSKNIREVIALKRRSGCSFRVTGGTEYYHHTRRGSYTHFKGYKLDISRWPCITSYIQRSFKRGPNRGSHPSYEDSRRNIIYYKEGNHWDILYK